MLLELCDITKRYESVGGADAPAVLSGLHLQVERGRSVAIVGPSGSGKTTLLNLIGSLDRPTSGRVLFDGHDLTEFDEKQLAELRNKRIGFVFQLHHLLPQCTVLENVLLPVLACADADRSAAEKRVNQLIERVGLTDRIHHRPDQLSGGQRQRVAVVRALINQPDLILADEPTGALDHANAENLIDLLIELQRELGTALVVVTHATALVARFDMKYTLVDGRLREGMAPA